MRTFLLVAIALAGCTTAVSSAAAPAPPIGVEITGCEYMEGIDIVPGALVDPLVPADFQVAGTATLLVGLATCDAVASDGRSGVVTFGWADVSVSPRAALRTPGVNLYLYRIEHVATDDLYRELHAAVGAECRVVDHALVETDLLASRASATDGGELVWDILVPASPAASGTVGRTPYREYGPALGGYAYLQGDLVDPGVTAVPGTIQVDAESPLATLRGPAWSTRIQSAPGYAIEGATIGFVASGQAPAPRALC